MLWISLAMATLVTLFILLCLAVCFDIGPFYNNKNKASRKAKANKKVTLNELETLLENALLKKRL